jgi:predicted DCC family thiol-disulfide oxidoreductase YuxK
MSNTIFEYQNKKIIFYDGFCILCSSLIKYIIRKDKNKIFWYSNLQSMHAADLFNEEIKSKDQPDSIVYLRERKAYFYSDAAMKILIDLGGVYKLIFIFYIIPKFLRDLIYRWIAKNRYRIFGKRDTCYIPDENITPRILN